jgi:hypothetical protein
MRNGRKLPARHQQGSASPFSQPKRWVSAEPGGEQRRFQSLKKDYERYLTLARAEAQSGNTVAAENYYQHAEHYLRSMSSDP